MLSPEPFTELHVLTSVLSIPGMSQTHKNRRRNRVTLAYLGTETYHVMNELISHLKGRSVAALKAGERSLAVSRR